MIGNDFGHSSGQVLNTKENRWDKWAGTQVCRLDTSGNHGGEKQGTKIRL